MKFQLLGFIIILSNVLATYSEEPFKNIQKFDKLDGYWEKMRRNLHKSKKSAAPPEKFVQLFEEASKAVESNLSELGKNLDESYETVKYLHKKLNTTWDLEKIKKDMSKFYEIEKRIVEQNLTDFRRRVDRLLQKMISPDDNGGIFTSFMDQLKTKNYGPGKSWRTKEDIFKNAKGSYEWKHQRLVSVRDARRKLRTTNDVMLGALKQSSEDVEKIYADAVQKLKSRFGEFEILMNELKQ